MLLGNRFWTTARAQISSYMLKMNGIQINGSVNVAAMFHSLCISRIILHFCISQAIMLLILWWTLLSSGVAISFTANVA